MNFYGQLISCHDHLWSNEFAVPCNGFWLFFLHANPSFHQNLRRRTLLYTVVLSPWQRVLLGLDF